MRHQPAAAQLRFVYASIRINLELERVGDYAEAIAREALRLSRIDSPLPLDRLQQIADLAESMLHDAIRSFVDQDPELASRTIEGDEAVNLLRDKLTSDVTREVREGPLPLEALVPLIMVIRRLERVSDQARNISMETLYLLTGEVVKHTQLGAAAACCSSTSASSCRSLMAEFIGSSLGETGLRVLERRPRPAADCRATPPPSWRPRASTSRRARAEGGHRCRQPRDPGRDRAAGARGQSAPSRAARARRCCSSGRSRIRAS